MGVTITSRNLEGEPQGVVISLSGEATVAEARTTKTALTAALAEHDVVVLDVGGLRLVDASFLQLLGSAQVTAGRRGKRFTVTGNATGILCETARAAGFAPQDYPADGQRPEGDEK